MKKIKLELDRLDVESFAVTPARGERGTVRGHDTVGCTPAGACETLFTCYSCDGGSCEGASCHLDFTCTDCGGTCAETCIDCG
jgi:hypothetical protein